MYTYKHVILVGIDGAGNFYRHTSAPMIRRVMAEGAGTDYCLTAVPTDSAQCWGSMLMGVTCKIHGLHNDKLHGATEPLATEEHPTVFRMIRDAMPDAILGSYSNWNPLNYGLIENGIGVTKETGEDEELCGRICECVKQEKPTFLFIQFDSVDGAGHAHGYGSENHLNQINICDGYAERIYNACVEAGIAEDTLFMITADHGGYGRGHGSDTDEEKWVFVAIKGKTVNKGGAIDRMQVKDFPAITLRALGLPANPNWMSHVPEGIFAE
jgi:predicted AlkP superfamily pyrophosphatase or phosphodiesterase